jgi:hypothetical protein
LGSLFAWWSLSHGDFPETFTRGLKKIKRVFFLDVKLKGQVNIIYEVENGNNWLFLKQF